MRDTADRRRATPHWSERQKQVLDLIADGRTNAEIGERLGITFATAKWHVSELITELGVDSREDVAAYWRAERGVRGRLRRAVGAIGGLGLWKVAAATAVAAGAAGIVIAVVATKPSPHPTAAGVAATSTSLVVGSTPTRIAAASPTTAPAGGLLPVSACEPIDSTDPREPLPIGVSMVSATAGWVLAEASSGTSTATPPPQCAWIGATTDGGKTWTKLPFSGIRFGSVAGGVAYINFVDAQTGWLWGWALYVTHDGGTTWTPEPTGTNARQNAIVSFSATGDAAWAIDGLGGDDILNCPCTMRRTTDTGAHWSPLDAAPLTDAMAAQVVAMSADDAWLAVATPPSGTTTPAAGRLTLHIFVTHDGGAHWSQVAAPPTNPVPQGQLVVAAPDTLWWAQWGEPATDMSSKWIYRSDDGGAHWQLIADDVLPSGGQLQNLPATGDFPQLTVVTPSLLFLWMDRAPPYVSRDGGATWTPAISEQATQADAMGLVGPAVFGDPTHGVVADFGLGLFVTDDAGKTWTLVHLPRT